MEDGDFCGSDFGETMIRLVERFGPLHGKCIDCGEPKSLHRHRCLACRHKPEHRAMIRAGIPCGTAGVLVGLMKKLKGKTVAQAETMLSFVHPIVMENLKIGKGWMLVPRSGKYGWVGRNGWNPIKPVKP